MCCSAVHRLRPPQRQVLQINSTSAPAARVTAVLRLQCASSKRKSLEGVLSELQSLSTSAFGIPSQKRQAAQEADASLSRLLAKAASIQGDMSVGQLCRFAFILTRLQDSSANIKPLWQAIWRRLLQLSISAAQHSHQSKTNSISTHPTSHDISTTSSHTAGSARTAASSNKPTAPVPHSQLKALLQSQASAGDVLYLLRALAAWRGDEVPAYASHSPDDGQAAGGVHVAAAIVAAASQKTNSMALKELLLSVTALAQCNYFDAHIMATASTAFVGAVAAAASTSDSSSSSSDKVPHSQSQHQQQQEEVLPRIKDHQLVINYLWANASLGYADPLLLQAGLQLLLMRSLVNIISKSHLPLCMWALAALLVLQLHNHHHHHHQQQQQQQVQGEPHASDLQQGQQQQQRQLVQAVAAVHSMLAAQAHQLWQAGLTDAAGLAAAADNGSSLQGCSAGIEQGRVASIAGHKSSRHSSSRKAEHKGSGSSAQHQSPFSIDSRRQMYQAYVWLEAAAAAAAGDTPAVDKSAAKLMPTHQAANVDGGLWPLTRLLAEAQQQQQQQQQQVAAAALLKFWQYCGEAWSGSTTQVSGLQREVFQALQDAGLQPILEFPAQPVQHLSPTQVSSVLQQQQQQQQGGCSSASVAQLSCEADQAVDGSEVGSVTQHGKLFAGAIAPGFLSIDIACVMPAHVLRHAQQRGLKAAIAQLQKQHSHDEAVDTADTSSSGGGSSSSSRSSSGSSSYKEGLLVAIEVDGPTHVAVNSASHQLGATVCRNWLLRQWGWEVLVVPWWEWQDKQVQVCN